MIVRRQIPCNTADSSSNFWDLSETILVERRRPAERKKKENPRIKNTARKKEER
jgi:hypothetical protein